MEREGAFEQMVEGLAHVGIESRIQELEHGLSDQIVAGLFFLGVQQTTRDDPHVGFPLLFAVAALRPDALHLRLERYVDQSA